MNGATGGVGGRTGGRSAEKVGEDAVVFGTPSFVQVKDAVAVFGELAQETATSDPNIRSVLDASSRLEKEIGSSRDVIAHLAAIARLLSPESVGAAGKERVRRGGDFDVGFAVRLESGSANIPFAHGAHIDAPSCRQNDAYGADVGPAVGRLMQQP